MAMVVATVDDQYIISVTWDTDDGVEVGDIGPVWMVTGNRYHQYSVELVVVSNRQMIVDGRVNDSIGG